MVTWRIVYTKQAQKDAKKIATAGLKPKAEKLLEVLSKNPFQTPPPFEKLIGDLSEPIRSDQYQHRLVYQVLEEIRTVKTSEWTHYNRDGRSSMVWPFNVEFGGWFTCLPGKFDILSPFVKIDLIQVNQNGGQIMKALSVSEAKMKLSGLIETINATDEEIIITKTGRLAAVLVSPEEFESLKETIALRSDLSLMKEIKKGLRALKVKKTKLYTLEELFH
jgi:Txe/YoeB family toxin of toxin-antitoxin system